MSLLFSRLFFFLHAGFKFLENIAAEKQFSDASDLRSRYAELEYRCALLARLLERPAQREVPYASPSSYRKYLDVFARFANEADPLASLLPPVKSVSDNRVEYGLRDEFEYAAPIASETAAGWSRPHLADGGPREQEISAPVVAPEVLADPRRPNDRTYRVWYGTDRAPVQPTDVALGFSSTIDSTLRFGSCLVFVPQSHEVGSLGSTWLSRTLILRLDDRLRLDLIRPLARDAFQTGIAAELARRRDGRTALVYLHGFNVSFEDAAKRTAQLACDLSVNGVAAFYSWASAGKLLAYAKDEETVRLAVDHFAEFLDTLLSINGLDRVDIVAHSMGNRLLAAVIERLSNSSHRARIGHLVLAAPDIARTEFARVSAHYGVVASERVTLYSCARDSALALSTRIHDYLRVGYEPPVYCSSGLDTISANHVPLDLLGHGYIASSKPVIADLKKLLWENMPPSARGLTPLPDLETPEYWLLPKS